MFFLYKFFWAQKDVRVQKFVGPLPPNSPRGYGPVSQYLLAAIPTYQSFNFMEKPTAFTHYIHFQEKICKKEVTTLKVRLFNFSITAKIFHYYSQGLNETKSHARTQIRKKTTQNLEGTLDNFCVDRQKICSQFFRQENTLLQKMLWCINQNISTWFQSNSYGKISFEVLTFLLLDI